MNMRSEDFLIRVRPFKDIDGTWNGDIDLSIITQPANDLPGRLQSGYALL